MRGSIIFKTKDFLLPTVRVKNKLYIFQNKIATKSKQNSNKIKTKTQQNQNKNATKS